MKGGYIILDIKKCQFTLNEDESEYTSNNNYSKDFSNALYKTNKTVLIENINTLDSAYSSYKNALFVKAVSMYTDGSYISFSLPVGSEPSVFVYANGTITIDN